MQVMEARMEGGSKEQKVTYTCFPIRKLLKVRVRSVVENWG